MHTDKVKKQQSEVNFECLETNATARTCGQLHAYADKVLQHSLPTFASSARVSARASRTKCWAMWRADASMAGANASLVITLSEFCLKDWVGKKLKA